jgi:uncharacterized RmlC-like cupin family protein
MSESRQVVVNPREGIPEASSLTERRQFFDRDGSWAGWAGWIRNDAGDVSGWHHHAANETYVYLIRGSLTVDFGPGGAESVVASAGDFVFIPPQTIHRESTGQDSDIEALVLRVGGEPEHIKVDGPETVGG